MHAAIQRSFRQHWREFKRGRPGHRFEDRYERARRAGRHRGAWQRIAFIAGAIVCFIIGAILAVIPGPALPFFFLGGGLLATESRVVSRFMDWAEVRVRKIVAWARSHWRRLPMVVRVILVVLGACCSAAAAYLGYRLMQR